VNVLVGTEGIHDSVGREKGGLLTDIFATIS